MQRKDRFKRFVILAFIWLIMLTSACGTQPTATPSVTPTATPFATATAVAAATTVLATPDEPALTGVKEASIDTGEVAEAVAATHVRRGSGIVECVQKVAGGGVEQMGLSDASLDSIVSICPDEDVVAVDRHRTAKDVAIRHRGIVECV